MTDSAALFSKKAMDIAKAPLGGLAMKAFMLWMVGSSIHLFTIFAVATALFQPIKAIIDTNSGACRTGAVVMMLCCVCACVCACLCLFWFSCVRCATVCVCVCAYPRVLSRKACAGWVCFSL
jgi:hypothetical protein